MTEKIKILHLIKTLSLGGAETNLLNLARAIDPNRYEIHVAYSYGGEIENRFKESGVRLFKYASGSHRIQSFATLGIIWRLAAYLRKHKIRVVHTHVFNAQIWGMIAAKLSGAKLVEHVHDFRYWDAGESRHKQAGTGQYRYAKYFKNTSDRVVVLTQQNSRYLVQNGFYPAEKVTQIHNGIPILPAIFQNAELRKRLGLTEGPVVLTPSRLSEDKNIRLILEWAPRVIEKIPSVQFVIAGNGPLMETLKNKVRMEGLEKNIRLIGFYDNIDELLSLAAVFLLPSFLELHSISVLEAMRMAVPVVISKNVGCHDEFIADGENGILLDPFSQQGWAEAVIKLLQDAAWRKKIGGNGRRTCQERFDIRDVAKQFENLYEELSV